MTQAPTVSEHAERFTLLRPLLFTIAYEMLGSAADAVRRPRIRPRPGVQHAGH